MLVFRKILRTYKLIISYPTFPLIYCQPLQFWHIFDASTHFKLISPPHHNLRTLSELPSSLLIGISKFIEHRYINSN